MQTQESETPPWVGAASRNNRKEVGSETNKRSPAESQVSPGRTPWDEVRRVTRDLDDLCDWWDDLSARIRRAQLAFETIGLSEERRAELQHETRAFLAVARLYGESIRF